MNRITICIFHIHYFTRFCAQCADQSSAVLNGDLNLAGGGRELIRLRGMLIEAADLAKGIDVILKETRGRRDFRVPNAGGFHVPERKRRDSTRYGETTAWK